MKSMERRGGFTLVEMLFVISIIAVLSTIVLGNLSTARTKARIATAQGQLKQFEQATALLESDTLTRSIGGTVISGCADPTGLNDELILMPPNAIGSGLRTSAVSYGVTPITPWRGPYFTTLPNDPWGNAYILDPDYTCTAAQTGCAGWSTTILDLRVIFSKGPDLQTGVGFFADNIVEVLCDD